MGKYQTDEQVRNKIDNLLIEYRSIESNQGKDSTEKEREHGRQKQRAILDKIKPIDEEHWEILTDGENQRRGNGFSEWYKKFSHLLKIF